MIRLVFSDLRDNCAIWVGAFIIAVVCGYIGGWAASIEATSATYENLRSFSIAVIAFSSLAALPVLASASNLTVSAQRRSYALWQLANVKPRFVSFVVLIQLAVVAVLGAACGTLLEALTFAPFFPWVFSSYDPPANVQIKLGENLMPVVWFVVAAIFIVGGMKGAVSAGKTPPLTVLREPEPKRIKMSVLRVLLFIGLAVLTCALAISMEGSEPGTGLEFSLYMPILVTATVTPLAPLLCSALMKAWTSLVPRTRWNAWFLARRTASYGLSTSTSVETPVIVGFGLIAGVFSLSAVMGSYVQERNMSGYSTTLDWTSSVLLLGGPVLLCAVGAAVSVIMSSRSRSRDVSLLIANGAQSRTLVAAAACEALIHVVTATMIGMVCVVVSNAIVAHAVRLPLFADLTFTEGFAISLIGFALILAATLIPTLRALSRETAIALSVQE